ncbi:MAG: hypothetical protein ABI461_15130, partial [Polyangiaceae bacterium]
MIGGGRGINIATNGSDQLDLVLQGRMVVSARLEHPSQPDELVPIVNGLDFKGLSLLDPQQVP